MNNEYEKNQSAPTPDDRETGEMVRTPRGTFYLTNMTREEMEAAGYGLHHQSRDGKYLIMGNGSRAFAIRNEETLEKMTVLVVEPDRTTGEAHRNDHLRKKRSRDRER